MEMGQRETGQRMTGVLMFGDGAEGDPCNSTVVSEATAWELLEEGQVGRISGSNQSYRIRNCNLEEPQVIC